LSLATLTRRRFAYWIRITVFQIREVVDHVIKAKEHVQRSGEARLAGLRRGDHSDVNVVVAVDHTVRCG